MGKQSQAVKPSLSLVHLILTLMRPSHTKMCLPRHVALAFVAGKLHTTVSMSSHQPTWVYICKHTFFSVSHPQASSLQCIAVTSLPSVHCRQTLMQTNSHIDPVARFVLFW